jgi:oligopeptide transport system permease protein
MSKPDQIEFRPDDFELADGRQTIKIDKTFADVSITHDALIRFCRNKGAMISLIVIVLIVVMAIIGPGMNQYSYSEMDTSLTSLPPKVSLLSHLGIFDGMENGKDMYAVKNCDTNFWFGTDTLGRDLWTRVWAGTRVSLEIALIAAIGNMLIGVIYGLISGYLGGKADMIMQRIIEIINGIPSLVVMTLMVMVMSPGKTAIIVALLSTGWIGTARMVRGQTMKIREEEFVQASQTLGASVMRILFKDALPNIMNQVIIMAMFSIPSAIFAESFLAFVGLGLPQPQPSLGILISEGYKSLTIHPHMLLIPVLILSILMLSFNLLADGLRDALDPKQKDQ